MASKRRKRERGRGASRRKKSLFLFCALSAFSFVAGAAPDLLLLFSDGLSVAAHASLNFADGKQGRSSGRPEGLGHGGRDQIAVSLLALPVLPQTREGADEEIVCDKVFSRQQKSKPHTPLSRQRGPKGAQDGGEIASFGSAALPARAGVDGGCRLCLPSLGSTTSRTPQFFLSSQRAATVRSDDCTTPPLHAIDDDMTFGSPLRAREALVPSFPAKSSDPLHFPPSPRSFLPPLCGRWQQLLPTSPPCFGPTLSPAQIRITEKQRVSKGQPSSRVAL